MGHQDNGLCAIIDGVFDCREGANNTLVIRDGGAVQGDVEVDLCSHLSEQPEPSLSPAKVCESRVCTRTRTRLSLRSTSVMARNPFLSARWLEEE